MNKFKLSLVAPLLATTLYGSSEGMNISLSATTHSVDKDNYSESIKDSSISIEGKKYLSIEGQNAFISMGLNHLDDRDTLSLQVGLKQSFTELYLEGSAGLIYEKWSDSPLKSSTSSDSTGYSPIISLEVGSFINKDVNLFSKLSLYELETEINQRGSKYSVKDSGSISVGVGYFF